VARTRTSAKSRSLARLFAEDPLGAVLAVLRDAPDETGLRADQVKRALAAGGVSAEALRRWRAIQARLVTHERVSIGGDRYLRTYRYIPEPPKPSPAEALALLAGHRLPSTRRAELVEILRAALGPRSATERSATERTATDRSAPDRGQRELEQREKDVIAVLVDLAVEVEELATNQASTRALVHTVRNRIRSAMLEPVERAGETTHFDRSRHQSVGGPIVDGAPVVVVRPGYIWNGPHGKVLVARAVVQDRGKH
jgi:hypothetical protein